VHGQEEAGQPRRLRALETLIDGTDYQGFHVASTKTAAGEPYDERNLVVLSRFPVAGLEQLKNEAGAPHYRKATAQPPEAAAKVVQWERPILHATLQLSPSTTLHVINLHLKSRIPTPIDGQMKNQYTWKTVAGWAEGYFISSMKRVGQALETRMLIDRIFDGEPHAWIAVCGDFNSESDEVTVTAIRGPVEETGNPELSGRVLVPCENTVPESSRYSLLHLGKGAMLDHLLVSRALVPYYRGAEIHNEVLPDESGAFRTDVQFPESDHAPVVAEFVVP
jgi:hypothetical protein